MISSIFLLQCTILLIRYLVGWALQCIFSFILKWWIYALPNILLWLTECETLMQPRSAPSLANLVKLSLDSSYVAFLWWHRANLWVPVAPSSSFALVPPWSLPAPCIPFLLCSVISCTQNSAPLPVFRRHLHWALCDFGEGSHYGAQLFIILIASSLLSSSLADQKNSHFASRLCGHQPHLGLPSRVSLSIPVTHQVCPPTPRQIRFLS